MEQKFLRTITKANLKDEITLLNLDKDLKNEEKFKFIIRNCDEDLGKLIVNEDIRSWDSLFKLFPKKNDLASKVVKICCEQRKPKERRTDFIRRISDELLRFGTSEEIVIKFLSNKIWPNNEMRMLELSRNTSIDDLVYHAETLIKMDLKNKNAAKLFCKKCRKNGHLDINCSARN